MKYKNKKGFSFIEMIVALFIFSIVLTIITAIFSDTIKYIRTGRIVQKNIEDAKFFTEYFSKSVRESGVMICDGSSNGCNDGITLGVFDYSQNKCIMYAYDSTSKKMKSGEGIYNEPNCDFSGVTFDKELTSNFVNQASFTAVPTDSGKVGKVTISMEICGTDDCTGPDDDLTKIQTTVSLRDYDKSGEGSTTPPASPYCGDGSCNNGETCSSCPADCGACATIYCGDGSCNGSETCSSCPADCGACATSSCDKNGTCSSARG